MNIFKLLDEAIAQNASDLHLSTHSRPLVRVNGNLIPIKDHPLLTKDDLTEAFSQITTVQERDQFQRELELDSGYTLPDGTRLRSSAAMQRGVLSLAIRILPPKIPT